MNQIINEGVGRVFPVQIQWRNRDYRINKVGTFDYYSSVAQHRANGMWGKIIVE